MLELIKIVSTDVCGLDAGLGRTIDWVAVAVANADKSYWALGLTSGCGKDRSRRNLPTVSREESSALSWGLKQGCQWQA